MRLVGSLDLNDSGCGGFNLSPLITKKRIFVLAIFMFGHCATFCPHDSFLQFTFAFACTHLFASSSTTSESEIPRASQKSPMRTSHLLVERLDAPLRTSSTTGHRQSGVGAETTSVGSQSSARLMVVYASSRQPINSDQGVQPNTRISLISLFFLIL